MVLSLILPWDCFFQLIYLLGPLFSAQVTSRASLEDSLILSSQKNMFFFSKKTPVT